MFLCPLVQIYPSDVCDEGFVSHLVVIAGIQLVFPVTHKQEERQTMKKAAWLEKTQEKKVTHES